MAGPTRLKGGAGLECAFREEWTAIVAALARRLGDLQAAEDAAAEAFAAAARAWTEGMPPNPGGWLMLTARRKAVDQLRRDRTVSVDPDLLGDLAHGARALDEASATGGTIAALHAAAPSVGATDWAQIAALYGTLARLTPSPVVEINRAVAVGMADGPQAGLAILEPVLAAGTLTGYAPLHAAHADLLERLGSDEAGAAWSRAAAAAGNTALQRELRRRTTER